MIVLVAEMEGGRPRPPLRVSMAGGDTRPPTSESLLREGKEIC